MFAEFGYLMHRTNVTLILVLLFGIGLASCRTSQQQARRSQSGGPSSVSPATNHGTTNGPSYDSLLMIEKKLTEVIDSLSLLVTNDHSRLRALEQEVSMLRARIGRVPSAPSTYTPPPTYPAQNYAPAQNPPPAYIPQQNSVVAPSSNSASNIQDRYAAALRLFNDNAFDRALAAFRDIEHEDPKGAYASNAVYWQGESYYARGRYNEALQEFGIVLQQYPTSGKVADAQFKLGETYEKMGLKSSARDAYEHLLANYPNSDYTTRAKARLKRLQQ